MKRKLLTQMLNEWRTNVWLAVELLLVSVVMWFLADQLWRTAGSRLEPTGSDISHVYYISHAKLTEDNPGYVKRTRQEECEDVLTLMARLEARPEIEAVGTGQTSLIYCGSNNSKHLKYDTLDLGQVQMRQVTPGFIRVFRIHGIDGETPEEMADMLSRMTPGEMFVSENILRRNKDIASVRDCYGKWFTVPGENDSLRAVRAFPAIRNNDYHPTEYSWPSMMMPLPPKQMRWANNLVVRVRDNMDTDFEKNLMADATGPLRVGNYYISSVESMESIRRKFQLESAQEVTNTVMTALFLLLNIFLGVLGTFWFRTSQRIPEIALRMSVGATRRDIFNRVIAEGELILLLVTPLAGGLDWLLTHYELNTYYHGSFFEPLRFFGCMAITWSALALMIAVSSMIPALRAMKISPAEALKTE
ncbi:MAG: ABC transporter permease [Duncaniella sp.]|nr:ABC transporter permease [Duncaniella sp.]MDE5734129.1 ABC transporter permease [Duncaniella sp.]